MAKHKKNQKPTTKKQSLINTLKSHKLITVLALILLVITMTIPYNKYKDWDNAQLIKGLARDFPLLVSDIEAATGLELDQKVDCSITQEKYSSGVKTCELSVGKVGDKSLDQKTKAVIESSEYFSNTAPFENNDGLNISYRNKNACDIGFNLGKVDGSSFYLTCITAVREANIDLAKEVFQNL